MSKATANTHQKFWSLTWPLILTNITVPLLGLVDTAVLGHLDDAVYLAAVAIGANIFTFVFWAFGFLRMGTTSLAAQSHGAKDQNALRLTLLRGLVLANVIAFVLLILQTPVLQLGLALLQTNAAMQPHAWDYSSIRIWGAPAVLMSYVITGWLIAVQRTKATLALALVANGTNIALDLLFVVGFGMKTAGVALGTVLAEYSALAFGLAYVYRYLKHAPDTAFVLNWKPLFEGLAPFLHANGYLFVRTFALLCTFGFFTAQGALLGTTVVATNAVLLTFLLLISSALDGYAHSLESLCGSAFGKKDKAALYQYIRVGTLWSIVSAALLSCAFFIFGEHIIALLTSLPEIRRLANQTLFWVAALPCIAVWSYLFDGIFIGTSKLNAMQNTMLFSVFIVFLPTWWLCQPLGNHGLWLALWSFLIARGASQAALCVYYHRNQKWFESPT